MKWRDTATFERVDQYICDHITEIIPLETICLACQVSRFKVQQIFKEASGKTVGEYITEQKIVYAARQLLNTDQTILKIANEIHFTKSYLHTRFKALYHCTPDAFRQQYRNTTVIPKSADTTY